MTRMGDLSEHVYYELSLPCEQMLGTSEGAT